MGNLPWSPKSRRECWIFSIFSSGEARQTPRRHPSTEHQPDRPVPPHQPPLGLLLRRVETLIIDFLFSLTFLPPLAAAPPNLSGPDRTARRCSRRALKDRLDCLGLLPDFSYFLLCVLPPM